MYYLRYFLLLISLVLYHFVSAQYFQSAFGTGSHVDDSTIESVMDNSGNIYLTGYAYLGTAFGDYQIQNRGIYLAKLNPQGEVMWVFESDGSSDTQATGLALDSESNVYITGIFDHGFSIGPYEFNINLGDRMYLAKFTTDGELLWAKEFGSTNYRGKVFPNGIQIDKDDQVIIAGSFIEDVVFDDYHLESKEGYNYSYHDLFLTKLNQNGDVIWAKRMGGKYDDYCYSLHFDGNENIYLSGTFSPKEADFDSLLIDLENTSTRGYVLKLNTTGESQWIRYHEYGDNSTSESHMVASDSKGAVYSLGTYYNTLILDRDTLDSGDLFLVKYDEAGNQVYSKSINSQVYHYGYVPGYVVRRSGDIKVDHENSLFLSSNFKQVLYFEQDTLVSQGGGTPKADIFI
ncbi:MAG: hypothetical protein GQ527_10160, partial [Bacteroidales bacterium]|nr:hypothetical protein [Bacteroidales bacterium]